MRARASALAGRDSRNAWRATCRLNVAKGGSRLARGWLVTPGRRLIRVDSPAYGVSPTRGAVTSMVRRRSTIRIRLRRDRVERRGGLEEGDDTAGSSSRPTAGGPEGKGESSTGGAAPCSHRSPSREIGIQPERGCHRAVTRLYPPLARKRDRDRTAGTARLLLSSAGFVSFRAPIDSVMDPGGQPRRPTDLFLSLRCGFGPLKGWKTRRLTRGRCFIRSAAPHRREGFGKNSKFR